MSDRMFLSPEKRAALEQLVLRHEAKKVVLPGTPELHCNQKLVARTKARFKVLTCGRRFGKTTFMEYGAIRRCQAGQSVGWFAPNYKFLEEPWRDLKRILKPITESSHEVGHNVQLNNGGLLDMWTMDGGDPGRGRAYDHIFVDEAALVANLQTVWNEAMRPTLTDRKGGATFGYTPKGNNYAKRLYGLGQDPSETEWASWRMPTTANPYISADEVEAARKGMPELAFRQEYLAEFIEEAGGVFRYVGQNVRVGDDCNEEPSPDRVYTGGVDIARTNDFTVVTVVDDTGRQVYFDRFNEISWDRIHSAVARAAQKYGAKMYVDATGVGAQSVDALRKLGVLLEPIVFNNTLKTQAMDNLDMMFEQGEVSLMDIAVQTEELQSFQYSMTDHGTVRMEAPSGLHDDTCIALALSVFRLHQNFTVGDLLTAGNVRQSYSAIDGAIIGAYHASNGMW